MFFELPTSATATPEKTLEAFVRAVNRRDRRTMEALVFRSKNTPSLGAAFKKENKSQRTMFFVFDVKVKQLSTTQAVVQYVLEANLFGRSRMVPSHEHLEMRKEGGKWLIVAAKSDTKSQPCHLAGIAAIVV